MIKKFITKPPFLHLVYLIIFSCLCNKWGDSSWLGWGYIAVVHLCVRVCVCEHKCMYRHILRRECQTKCGDRLQETKNRYQKQIYWMRKTLTEQYDHTRKEGRAMFACFLAWRLWWSADRWESRWSVRRRGTLWCCPASAALCENQTRTSGVLPPTLQHHFKWGCQSSRCFQLRWCPKSVKHVNSIFSAINYHLYEQHLLYVENMNTFESMNTFEEITIIVFFSCNFYKGILSKYLTRHLRPNKNLRGNNVSSTINADCVLSVSL